MRAITKGTEPKSLETHRKTSYSDYTNYAEKNQLRNSLVTEQRGLCCYCMGRIIAPLSDMKIEMKIEHWHCQENYPAEQLTYSNMLGACMGGEGLPYDLQHCDTRKGNQDLKWNPANPNHSIEARIRYEVDGSIRSNDPQFDTQLDDVLKLNLDELKNRRIGSITALTEWYNNYRYKHHRSVPRDELVKKRNKLLTGTGELNPYCQVAVWWLDQKLAKVTT
ncbi:MAG: TIGR02646 family protein [Magnetococcales bacterium]|nr:TIGR02646 family protein [Magnetococcales bacterium]